MFIHISIAQQSLTLFDAAGQVLRRYPVSTASRGVGEQRGSYCTPRGRHLIRAKLGAGQPENAVFVARRPSGEIYSPELGSAFPGRDWILTRILWLSGCEPQRNRLGCVDTMRRYIYIHGLSLIHICSASNRLVERLRFNCIFPGSFSLVNSPKYHRRWQKGQT